jgi:hypothetical protein
VRAGATSLGRTNQTYTCPVTSVLSQVQETSTYFTKVERVTKGVGFAFILPIDRSISETSAVRTDHQRYKPLPNE